MAQVVEQQMEELNRWTWRIIPRKELKVAPSPWLLWESALYRPTDHSVIRKTGVVLDWMHFSVCHISLRSTAIRPRKGIILITLSEIWTVHLEYQLHASIMEA
jgi:hypothetical protein